MRISDWSSDVCSSDLLSDFANPEKREDWADNRNMMVFQLWDPANLERSVDVFVREPLDFGRMLADAVVKDLDGIPIRVASIRHLILLKQSAGRDRKSTRLNSSH